MSAKPSEYPYLDEPARGVIHLGPAERLAWLEGQRIWIPYPAATEILSDIDALIRKPRHHRMRGKLIISPSNNGKSRLAQECIARHPADFSDEVTRMPAFLLEMPPKPDEAAILDGILLQLKQPFRRHDPVTEKREHVITILRRCELRVLLVDEMQRLLGCRVDVRRVVMDALRYIANRVPVPLVVFSTDRGANALSSSDEMINRLPPTVLPPWRLDATFRSLLASHEGILPLREHSRLTTKATTSLIHTMTEGLIGEVRDVLELAVALAFSEGLEKIDDKLIGRVPWTSPSNRKRLVGVPGKIQ